MNEKITFNMIPEIRKSEVYSPDELRSVRKSVTTIIIPEHLKHVEIISKRPFEL